MVRPPTPPRPPDNWPRHLRIPDGERKISKAVYEQCDSRKLRYVFVVRFKDAAGDVLKTLKIPMPTREVMPVTVWNGEIEIAMLSSHMEIPISSNIDIKNIRDIEYVIEERVTNTN